MPTKKKIDEQEVEKATEKATKTGLPDAIFEEEETTMVSDPYMAVQGAPVSPSKVYLAERGENLIELLVPVPFTQALLVYLKDYAYCESREANGVSISTSTVSHHVIYARVMEIFPTDEVFESVLSMLERMEKLYLSEKANQQ